MSIGTIGIGWPAIGTILSLVLIIGGAFFGCGAAMGAWEPWSDTVDPVAWPIGTPKRRRPLVAVGPGKPDGQAGPLSRRKAEAKR